MREYTEQEVIDKAKELGFNNHYVKIQETELGHKRDILVFEAYDVTLEVNIKDDIVWYIATEDNYADAISDFMDIEDIGLKTVSRDVIDVNYKKS